MFCYMKLKGNNFINLSTILLGLKIFCLNGSKNEIVVKSTIVLPHQWMKDDHSLWPGVLLEPSPYRIGNIYLPICGIIISALQPSRIIIFQFVSSQYDNFIFNL